jgi:hypothetical protein
MERTLSNNWGEWGHVVTAHATYVTRRQVILSEGFRDLPQSSWQAPRCVKLGHDTFPVHYSLLDAI